MLKKLTIICALTALVGISDLCASNTSSAPSSADYSMTSESTYDGHYMRTNYSVTIYTEGGHCKGTYAIYLHNGDRYIRFQNCWICIQGKQRFHFSGNWYVIK